MVKPGRMSQFTFSPLNCLAFRLFSAIFNADRSENSQSHHVVYVLYGQSVQLCASVTSHKRVRVTQYYTEFTYIFNSVLCEICRLIANLCVYCMWIW